MTWPSSTPRAWAAAPSRRLPRRSGFAAVFDFCIQEVTNHHHGFGRHVRRRPAGKCRTCRYSADCGAGRGRHGRPPGLAATCRRVCRPALSCAQPAARLGDDRSPKAGARSPASSAASSPSTSAESPSSCRLARHPGMGQGGRAAARAGSARRLHRRDAPHRAGIASAFTKSTAHINAPEFSAQGARDLRPTGVASRGVDRREARPHERDRASPRSSISAASSPARCSRPTMSPSSALGLAPGTPDLARPVRYRAPIHSGGRCRAREITERDYWTDAHPRSRAPASAKTGRI